MKKLLVLLFSILMLSFSVNASDVYYCSDDDTIGFRPAENYKIVNLIDKKFKILIDFENKKVVSEEIFLGEIWVKKCFRYLDMLNCMSNAGITFGIDKTNLKYVRSRVYQDKKYKDDIALSHGTCEKF